VKHPVVLEFWLDEYEQLRPSYQSEFARPITNRLRKFYRNPRIGRVVGRTSSLDFREIMDEGKIFLAKLTGISEIESETIGALLISRFQLAAMSRTQVDPKGRSPYYLYVDEVQNLTATSLDVLLSEARKTGLSLLVANQFLRQLEGPVLESIMGNVGTTIMFAVGPKDASTLAPYVRSRFTVDDLVNLDRFDTIVRMQSGGATQPPFSLRSLEPLPLPKNAKERAAGIRALSNKKHARPNDEVDAELLDKYQQHFRQTQNDAEGDSEASYFD
jgi:hypothetical protein